MSIPQIPGPAKLVTSLFLKDKNLLETLVNALIDNFGEIDFISNWFDFDYTNYYMNEMGSPLFRRMVSFNTLIDRSLLPDIKITTNQIESTFIKNQKRKINIDPGYLVHENFILATGKHFSHRIYLNNGIYADLTLFYQKNNFQVLPWTYPDYADNKMNLYLKKVRNKYIKDLNK